MYRLEAGSGNETPIRLSSPDKGAWIDSPPIILPVLWVWCAVISVSLASRPHLPSGFMPLCLDDKRSGSGFMLFPGLFPASNVCI